LVKAAANREILRADDLLREATDIYHYARGLFEAAETVRDGAIAVREMRGCLDLLGRLLGELREPGVVNLVLSVEWVETRAVIMQALAPYPDAAVAVADALDTR
jgi:hypothetical protein